MSKEHIADRASVYDKVEMIEEHMHSPGEVYPSLANGIVVAGAAGVWTLGSFVEIIPASTKSADFDIHYLTIEGVSIADVYEIVLYNGTTEIGRRRIAFVDIANSQTLPSIPFQTRVQDKDSQIQAKVANKAGGSESLTISLATHPY